MPDIEFNRQTVITFPDNDNLDDITTGIGSGSLKLNEILFSNELSFNTCNSTLFECELYGIDDITDEKIYVYQIVDEEEIPIFTGWVTSCKKDHYGYMRTIQCYDALQHYGETNIAVWYEQFWQDVYAGGETSSTLGTILRSLLDYVGIEYETKELLNDDLVINKTVNLSAMRFSEMLGYITQLQLCNIRIGRDGEAKFITLYDTDTITLDGTIYQTNDAEFETYTVSQIDTVAIYNEEGKVSGVHGDGTNTLEIKDNLFTYQKTTTELNAIATTLANALLEIPEYVPATLPIIVSDLSYEIGTFANTPNGMCMIVENELSGPQLVDQTLYSKGKESVTTSAYNAETQRLQTQIEQQADLVNTKYYTITNQSAIIVGDSETKTLLSKIFNTSQTGFVVFDAGVILNVDTESDDDLCEVSFTYYIGTLSITSYIPKETWHKGNHYIRLLYFWTQPANTLTTFRVDVTSSNGIVTVGAFQVNGYLSGQGLLGDTVWDGVIEVQETYGLIDMQSGIGVEEYTDTANATTQTPRHANLTENYGLINMSGGMSVIEYSDRLIFNEFYVIDYADYEHNNITYDDTLIDVIDGAYYLKSTTTPPVYVLTDNFTVQENGIEAFTLDASYDAVVALSFDGGNTYQVYTQNAWSVVTSDYVGMDVTALTAIPVNALENYTQWKARIILPNADSYFKQFTCSYLTS